MSTYKGKQILSLRLWASIIEDQDGNLRIDATSIETTKRAAREHDGTTIPVWINPIIRRNER